MYTQDYDERFPPTAQVVGTRSVTLPGLLHPYSKDNQVWECPTARKNGVKNQTYDGTPDDTTTSYGYNGHALAPKGDGVTQGQVRAPKDTISFIETDSILAVPSTLAPALGGTSPRYRHPTSDERPALNVGWVDGHVKRVEPGMVEEVVQQEGGKRLRSGIDSFRYWNLK